MHHVPLSAVDSEDLDDTLRPWDSSLGVVWSAQQFAHAVTLEDLVQQMAATVAGSSVSDRTARQAFTRCALRWCKSAERRDAENRAAILISFLVLPQPPSDT